MSEQEIFDWIGAIFSFSLVIIVVLLFLIIKISLNYKKKNKVKKILCSDNFTEIIGTREQLEINIEKYFKEIFIREVDINLFKKFLKSESRIGRKSTKIAWDFFIILITSVLANESQGKVFEAVKSIKNTFDESKKLLLSSDNGNLITDVILNILNCKIRPILVNSRLLAEIDTNGNFIINDKNLDEGAIKDFWNQVDKVRADLIENNYLYVISVLSFSSQTNKQIKNLLNYPNKDKITEY